MEGGKEKLDPREEAKKTISHLLNDFGEYPAIRLTDAEKVDKDKKLSEADPTLLERQDKWRRNKFSVTMWFTPVIGNIGLILESGFIPKENKEDFEKQFEDLRALVYKEQRENKITKETVDKADTILRKIKEAL